MGLSRHHLDTSPRAVGFSPEDLAERIRAECPFVRFALLLGSAMDGTVPPRSDLDLAVYLVEVSLDNVTATTECAERVVPGVRIDLGILNRAEPVYRFEAISGRLLFTRDREAWHRFFSLACREYESQMASYERQLRYRRAGKRAETRLASC